MGRPTYIPHITAYITDLRTILPIIKQDNLTEHFEID